jgi:flavodoxin I
MATVIVIYGTTTGNTEVLAEEVNAALKEAGAEATLKDVNAASVDELAGYDAIVLGCSTWGIGELQDDFIDFNDDLAGADLAGKKAAVFGPGDEAGYPDSFCEAVDILEATLKGAGAELVAEGLKIDDADADGEANARAWATTVAQAL